MHKLHTPHFYTLKGLMRILAISHSTAYDLVQSGEIRSIHVGRLYLIPHDAIRDFVRQRIYGMQDCISEERRDE